MDKTIQLFFTQLDSMCKAYKEKIYLMSFWQLDNNLPNEIKSKNMDDKVYYLLERYKQNPLYIVFYEDLVKLEKGENVSELESLNLDLRYLEGKGLNEKQIKEYYEFVNKVKSV